MRYARSFVRAAIWLLLWPLAAQAGDLRAENAWSLPTLGKVRSGVVYFTLTNAGKTDDVLLSAASPVSERLEIHRNEMKRDMIQMRRLENVALPAGQSVTFAPSGHHLMLLDLRRPLVAGERFPLTLTFEKAAAQTVEVEVRALETLSKENAHDR